MAAVKLLEQSNRNALLQQNVLLSNNDAALLYQNVPNPFEGQTSIAYYLPQKTQNALIKFVSLDCKLIKTVSLTEKGKGIITIDASNLTQGIYNYSLYVDGELIDTKNMMLKKNSLILN